MAKSSDDTPLPPVRGPPPGATVPPDHVNKPQVYEIFHGSSTATAPQPDQVGQTPGAKPDTETSSPKASSNQRLSISDGIKTVKREDWFNVHRQPCVRESLLTAIGSGVGIGGLRFVIGAPIPKATNWAASGFIFASIISYEYCQFNRRAEKAKMKRVVEVYDRKQTELKEKQEAQRRKREEEKRAREEESNRRWYKFW